LLIFFRIYQVIATRLLLSSVHDIVKFPKGILADDEKLATKTTDRCLLL